MPCATPCAMYWHNVGISSDSAYLCLVLLGMAAVLARYARRRVVAYDAAIQNGSHRWFSSYKPYWPRLLLSVLRTFETQGACACMYRASELGVYLVEMEERQ